MGVAENACHVVSQFACNPAAAVNVPECVVSAVGFCVFAKTVIRLGKPISFDCVCPVRGAPTLRAVMNALERTLLDSSGLYGDAAATSMPNAMSDLTPGVT